MATTDKFTCEVCKTDNEVILVSPYFRHEYLCKECADRIYEENKRNRSFLGEDSCLADDTYL